MDKLSRQEWENALEKIAVGAGKAWLEDMRSKENYDADELGQKGVHDRVLMRLMEEYPYEKVSNSDIKALEKTKTLDWANFVNGVGGDPRAVREKSDIDKYLPLLKGVAKEGQDWYSIGADALKYRAANEFGFPYTKEGFAEFLGNLGNYQKMYDRGQLVKEMDDKYPVRSTIAKLMFPTAYKGIENAVADPDNSDLSAAQAAGLTGLDALVDAGQFLAPSVQMPGSYFARRALANATADAVLQGALEAGRQAGGASIADVEPDYVSVPIATITAGATRPALIGTSQQMLSGFTGPGATSFREGIAGSMRVGNPVVQERQALADGIDLYNSMLKREASLTGGPVIPGVNQRTVVLDLPGKKKVGQAQAADMLRGVLDPLKGKRTVKETVSPDGVRTTEFFEGPVPESGPIDKERLLDLYDNLYPGFSGELKNGKFVVSGKTGRVAAVGDPENSATMAKINKFLTPKTEEILRTVIPRKMAELEGMNKAYRAGMRVGTVLGDVGGRVEPVIKVNPLNPFVSDSPLSDRPDAYKDTQWYQNLSDRSKAIVDAVFTGKQSGN